MPHPLPTPPAFPTVSHLPSAAAALADTWSPRVLAQVNDQYLKVARVQGELAWHAHADEDELFLVLDGHLRIEYQDRPHVSLGPGDAHVVPRGVMHNPVAGQPCLLALIEPVSTRHTGDAVTPRTRSLAEQLGAAAG